MEVENVDEGRDSLSGLTTRGMKRRKIDNELNECDAKEDDKSSFGDDLDRINGLGGSYLKYEILNKK